MRQNRDLQFVSGVKNMSAVSVGEAINCLIRLLEIHVNQLWWCMTGLCHWIIGNFRQENKNDSMAFEEKTTSQNDYYWH